MKKYRFTRIAQKDLTSNPELIQHQIRTPMKIDIEIDDALITDTLKATGLTSQHEVIELALKTLMQIKQQETIRTFRGKLPWDGDLDSMRTQA